MFLIDLFGFFIFFISGGGVSTAKRKSLLVSFYKSVVGTLFPPQESATPLQGINRQYCMATGGF